MVAKIGNFFTDSIAELKKVTSPTRQETIQATIVTLVFMLIVAVVLALLDAVLRYAMWRFLGGNV